MALSSTADNRSYLSYDLSFLPSLDPDKLDATALKAIQTQHERNTRLKYESMGIFGMTRNQSIEPVLSIRRIIDNINSGTGYPDSTYIKKKLEESTTSQTASIDRSAPYYIKIMTKEGKTATAGRIMDSNAARIFFKGRVPQKWLDTYGDEMPEQMTFLEFPKLTNFEQPKEGTYSELDATAALVQSCIQHSLEFFRTTRIKAIPVEKSRADLLSQLGFSYAYPQERDDPHLQVTAETEMIFFPEVRDAWELHSRNNPILLPPSFLNSKEKPSGPSKE